MNYQDQWATDEEGKQFVFTVEMQRQLQAAGKAAGVSEWLTYRKEYAPPDAPERGSRERAPRRDRNAITEREVDPATGKYIGVLKAYHADKGFGFIDQGDGQDIYFHRRRTLDDPTYMNMGQKVLYTLDTFRGKEEAVDVEEYE